MATMNLTDEIFDKMTKNLRTDLNGSSKAAPWRAVHESGQDIMDAPAQPHRRSRRRPTGQILDCHCMIRYASFAGCASHELNAVWFPTGAFP